MDGLKVFSLIKIRIFSGQVTEAGTDASQLLFPSDLRGIDIRETALEGASLAQAHVSACYFPKQLSATEIELAPEHGTRIRCGA